MESLVRYFRKPLMLCAGVGMLAWAEIGEAQTEQGQARAVQASVVQLFGINTVSTADTGVVSGADDAREASRSSYGDALVAGQALHASTITWAKEVASEASLAALTVNVPGAAIAADFVMARAQSVAGAPGASAAEIDGLSINGIPIAVSGQPNQAISIPGGWIVINEQRTSAGSAVVNALHVVVSGVADVVVASVIARVQ